LWKTTGGVSLVINGADRNKSQKCTMAKRGTIERTHCSIRDGFGSKGKWAWFLPAKPVKPAKKEADRPKDATTCEQARSVVVNLNGLPVELLSGHIPHHWVDGIARLESHRVPKEVPAHRWRQFINDCYTFLLAKENWAERAAGHGWMIWNCSAAAAVLLSASVAPDSCGRSMAAGL
jgi:hypothetical protein